MSESTEVESSRRPRGFLHADVKTICDLWVTGELKINGDKPLTPHRTAMAIKEVDSLDEAPSTGAVKAVFDRWKKYDFATFTENPFAFEGYTEEGQLLGWEGIMKKKRAEKADAKPDQPKN